MRPIPRIAGILNSFVAMVGKAAAWASIILIIVIVFDVVTRRFFVLGSTRLQELEWHLHAVVFLMSLGFTHVHEGHVRVELVSSKFPERIQTWIELFGTLFFFLPFVGIGLYCGFDFAHTSYVQGESSSAATGLPYRWVIKSFVPFGLGLLMLAGIARLLSCINSLFVGRITIQ